MATGLSNSKLNGMPTSTFSNAEAGPSSVMHRAPLDDFPAPRLARISASQDLLDTFGLSRFYDRYVRPFPNPTAPDLKGKARVKEEANAPRRMEKHLTYLTREVFGLGRMPKENRLRDLTHDPNIQDVEIAPFEDEALRAAFTLEVGQLPGYDQESWSKGPDDIKKKKKKRPREVTGESVDVSANLGGSPGDIKHRDKRRKKDGGDAG